MNLKPLFPDTDITLFKETTISDVMKQEIDGSFSISKCSYEICLIDGKPKIAGGIGDISHNAYDEKDKGVIRGEPKNVLSLNNRLFIIHFPKGIYYESKNLMYEISEDCLLIIMKDKIVKNNINRDPVRYWQTAL
ncbi:MAG: hypothetical protein A3G49_04060 [Candidatus Sungbacteria bacterium RIFCSPLOWO2_12_FULL_41_11]|uniref:Uncharacterized protein n=1 Tax=Candidatus Sungbacteria bacterium RIFCSPLOWO2_12_FULL_41_11 TaxID=1802286 RepID=A0A1G2LTA0_9BACT|nr:MAG: hypothetical protein UV01_C0010G0053 [Parcubacteria group bacterium GW2011_GWA2_42_14]OGZ99310.1 MAG: hypothetical protein A3D41_02530 [Candidatus Sungbacteria bacterium RIFCSPHIGHO2_02_FULL_41_12b]OHA14837.1 MAG: hypothetical protein A3G49_04060 [Candidatus Sungbacteria bacterium RIFCSPLOWO2_12_FULL_41_11]